MPTDEMSFTLFALLPAEIRLEIWKHCCHPRVVEVVYEMQDDQCKARTAPPPVLHICRESRYEASKSYSKVFGTDSHEASIWFSPLIDTLYIPRHGVMGYDGHCRHIADRVTDILEVSSLALDHVSPSIRRPWETYNKFALMQCFPNLSEIYMVLNNEDMGRDLDDDDEEVATAPAIELIDPKTDPLAMSRLLSELQESFNYEVGAEFGKQTTDDMEDGQGKLVIPPMVLKSKVATASSENLRMMAAH